ncbi:RNA 2',3'-cyclic phosphodiesterase [Natranaerobius trueperi]|uniref:RNA 2',3'-cyclic phosphodiesterase n=1 Tax=Natranaerobius trueperi TaxID=759412 RepID=A0A226BXJ7_9FIRM|nr:RNA 2',3'-cyclic phosphodiesterase [Natranaerobius trueperi]OWZ83753.1 RNA 2',3'-cyclic phosphodiesterase [Natranaerobius trueperi]
MRCFFALFFDEDVTKAIKDNQKICKSNGITGKYVAPTNIHLTLKFLGDVESINITTLFEVSDYIKEIQTLNLQLSDLGVFPNLKNPKVLWQGISGPDKDQLIKLHTFIDEFSKKRLGIEREKRKFFPHITLMRRPSFEKRLTINDIKKFHINKPEVKINFCSLIQSELTKKGPIYSELKRFYFL